MNLQSFLQSTELAPVYVYDAAIIDRQIHSLQKNLGELTQIHYAMKANPSLGLLQHIRQNSDFGVEIASGGELFLAQQAGWTGEQIIYTGPVKTNQELTEALAMGVKTIHVESYNEAVRLNTLCEAKKITQPVLLRINADRAVETTIQLSGKPSPFGVSESESADVLHKISVLTHLDLQGIHVYNASGILDAEVLLGNVRNIFSLVQMLEKETKLSLPVIDFGGGFGIDYSGGACHFELDSASRPNNSKSVDLQKYTVGLKKLIQEFGYQTRELILELGRYVVAESGYYCSRVIDVKDSRSEKFVLTDGGIHHLSRPALWGEAHPVFVVKGSNDFFPDKEALKEVLEKETVNITGCLCTNLDVLGQKLLLPPVAIGDWIVVSHAGAYGLSASIVGFLCHNTPAEILLVDGEAKKIRSAGTYEDFLVHQE
jgi:diaminopimelate decarboxylase